MSKGGVDRRRARRVAIVGAGVSGLACARALRESGTDVTVFDKARGAGGRASTRRGEDRAFDHGAQYFTTRDPRFAREVEAWKQGGIVQEWTGEIVRLCDGDIAPTRPTRRLVGVPGMSALGRHLAAPVSPRFSFAVAGIEREHARLTLVAGDGGREPGFDAVVLATPAPQAALLASALAPDLAARSRTVPFAPCWAVMLAFDDRIAAEFDGAFVDHSPVSWAARNSSKPGRPAGECWVLHASPSWSETFFGADQGAVIRELLAAFARALGKPLPRPVAATAHRWAFALPREPLPEAAVFDATTGLGACGDWCSGPRVEGAFLSGLAMAERLIRE